MKKILHLMAILFAVSLTSYVQSQNISGPNLGAAQEFAVLGSSAVNSTGSTLVYADLGTSPGTTLTGFPPGIILGEQLPGGTGAAAAQTSAVTAYNALGALNPTQNLTGQNLGKGFSKSPQAVTGTVLNSGVYRFDGNARLSGQLRFDGQGSANSLFVIQVNGDLIIEDGSVMSVQNGAQPNNIYFRVTGNIIDGNGSLTGTPAALKGNMLVQNNITLSAGTTHEGRLLSIGGSVSLSNNTIFLPTIAEADLAITKTVDKSEAAIGDIVTYTITVRNQGPSDATGVQVREIFPSQVAFLDYTSSLDGNAANFTYNASTNLFTIGNLAFGQTATIVVRTRVIASGTDIRNRVTVISNQPDPDDEDDEDNVPIVVPALVADLQVVKTVDKTRANVGDALTYTITARNNGPAPATGVVLVDILPVAQLNITGQPTVSAGVYNSATGNWTIGNLAAGQVVTMIVNATITGTGTIVNTATLRGNEVDQQPTNNTSTVITVVSPSTSNPNNPDNPGTDPENPGNPGTDPENPGNPGTDPENPGNPGTDPENPGNPGTGPDNPGNQGPLTDLQVVKSVDKAFAANGQSLTYTITARNLGPNNATGVTVTDVLPTSQLTLGAQPTVSVGSYNSTTGVWTIGNLAVGQTVTMTVTGTINVATGTIVNTAVIRGAETDERPESNTSTVVTTVGAGEPNPGTATDLQVVKTVDKVTAVVGQPLTYTVTARNNGPNAATGVLVIDVLPSTQVNLGTPTVSTGTYNPATGVWVIGNLAAGQTATLTVTGPITAAGAIVNTAVIRSNEADPLPGNNTSTVITNATPPVSLRANLAISKTLVGDAEVTLGQPVTFVLRASNAGPDAATGVRVTDVLPQGLVFVSADPSADFNSTTGVWTIGNLAVGQANARELRLTTTTTAVGRIANVAVVQGNQTDPNNNDNTDTEEVCVRPTAPIVGNATVCPGSNVNFNITPIAGVTIFEVTGLPTGVTRVAGGGNTVTLQVAANVAPGTYTLSFIAVNSNVNCSNSIPSTATLTVNNPVGTPGTITASTTTLCSLRPVTFSVTAVPGATSYLWTVPQGWTFQGNATGPFTTTQPTIVLIPSTTAGTVSVQAVNNCGPSAASTTTILSPGATPAAPTLSNNSGPCQGFAFSVVAPESGVTYNWVVPAGFTITSGQGTPSITLRVDVQGSNGVISVTASNSSATCPSDVATIDIDAASVESQLTIPTIFSPNGDGINDVWVIKNLMNFPDNDLYIYNRWGNEVYRARGYRNNWSAAGLEEATYFYVLRVRGCNGQEQVYRGYVQVAR